MHRIAIALLLVASAVGACSSGAKHEDSPALPPTPSAPTQPTPPPKDAPEVTIGDATVQVEVVSTEAAIERGLMYRQNLPPDAGMLFLMGKEFNWAFYMRNTLVPLDIIFIKKDMTVAGVAANAKPLDESLLRVGVPSLYVLEVNAGWAAAHHVTAGSAVKFVHVPPRES